MSADLSLGTRSVLRSAAELAATTRASTVDTIHLMLALLQRAESRGVASIGSVSILEARRRLSSALHPASGPEPSLYLPYSATAKDALALTLRHARPLLAGSVEPGHLFQVLFATTNGFVPGVILRHAGVQDHDAEAFAQSLGR